MSLDLDALRTFVEVAELSSFTRAAERLGLAKARVSLQVKQLESALGSKLLQRTTRVVRLTNEGEQFLSRAQRLLADAEELGSMFHAARSIRGRVRVDLPVSLAREALIPRLPELFARHPELEITLSATDRRVDALGEGFDCVLRVGGGGATSLVGRRLGSMKMMNCASPSYLRAYGVPRTLADLQPHFVVHYSSTLQNEQPVFEYPVRGGYAELPMRSLLTVNSVEAYLAAGIAGLGILQIPRAGKYAQLASGALVEVLPDLASEPMPVWLVHTHGRSVPKRVRAVMNWIAEVMTPYLQAIA